MKISEDFDAAIKKVADRISSPIGEGTFDITEFMVMPAQAERGIGPWPALHVQDMKIAVSRLVRPGYEEGTATLIYPVLTGLIGENISKKLSDLSSKVRITIEMAVGEFVRPVFDKTGNTIPVSRLSKKTCIVKGESVEAESYVLYNFSFE